jgi:Ca2+-binding EF-hand superfamily protein
VRRAQRLNSRFRAADQDRDGRLSATEIDAMKGRRF